MNKRLWIFVCAAALAGSAFAASKPQPIPNSTMYRDAGAKPATGRSGSAAIQVRALRMPSAAVIQVTTGQLDSRTPPPGTLDKVQIKIFNAAGDAILTDNFRLSQFRGPATFVYDWPTRGQKVQVQANVSGIDPKRTDVVTVDTTVKMPPDLAVSSISAPRQAYVGAVVPVTAVVRETNGDYGARANCVLKADGVIVDHANGIWVDAGDAVTCEFRTVFNTTGAKQLTAQVTNIVPTDFNASNNSASTTINIVPTSTPVWYDFRAEDTFYDQTNPQHSHDEFTSFDESTYPSYVRDSVGGWPNTTHSVSYLASLQIEKALEFPIALESRMIVDGQTLIAASGSVDYNPNSYMNFSGDGYWNKCGDFYDGWHSLFMCHFHSEFDGVVRDLSTAVSSSNAGSVTYQSWNTSTTRYDNGTVDVYTSNYAGGYITGETFMPFPDSLGNHVTVQGSYTDALNQHAEAEASVDLFPYPDYTYDYGEYCYSYDYTSDGWGRFTGTSCSWPVTVQHGRSGESTGTVQPQ